MTWRKHVDFLFQTFGESMEAATEDLMNRGRDRESILRFLSENDDAILTPYVLLSILLDRHEIVRLSSGSPAERKRAAARRKLLLEELTAYATPTALKRDRRPRTAPLPPEVKRLQAEIRLSKIAQARALAELAFLRRGEKKSVAFARFAAKLGAVAPEPEAAYPSRAAQRAEQRARKKAGEAPRPRGRPARPR